MTIQDLEERSAYGRQDLLAMMEAWRLSLAKNIALRNPLLRSEELDTAVHRTIDRILFLLICEGRERRRADTIRAVAGGEGVAGRLPDLIRRADAPFRSSLSRGAAAGKPGPAPVIDDKVLDEIISSLSPPGSPTGIPLPPPFILSQVYEIFLRKAVRLRGGHHARVEERPEVSRGGGASCTPRFIVDYIVKHAVAELVEGRTPAEVSGIRILDPACSSGSFLLVAYEKLLNWHQDWYLRHLVPVLLEKGSVTAPEVQVLIPGRPERGEEAERVSMALPICRVPDGAGSGEDSGWRLTTTERGRILLDNLFGVDIDPRAVEVTKMLLLTMVSGEGGGVALPAPEPGAPDPGRNFRCGNSLVGPDFFRQKQVAPYNYPEQRRIHPFDWDTEFTGIMAPAGFDAVIGNPPPARQESLKGLREYYQTHFRTYHDAADLPAYFIEKGITLLRPGGVLSFSTPNTWLRAGWGTPLRRWLRERQIEEIVDFGEMPAFPDATAAPCILRVRSAPPSHPLQVSKPATLAFPDLDGYVREHRHPLALAELDEGGWSLADVRPGKLLGKIREAGTPLDCLIIPRDDRYLLGVLNSRLALFFLGAQRPGAPRAPVPSFPVALKNFPVYVPDFDDPADTARHDRMVALVRQVLDLHRRLQNTTQEHEGTVTGRQIEATDREIDDLVYELYGLTEEEQRIVEEATGGRGTKHR